MKTVVLRGVSLLVLTALIIDAVISGAPPAHAAGTIIYLTTTATSTWTVPADWSSNNTIEVIGGGGGGSSAGYSGGGGGGYSKISNLILTPGASVSYQAGAGGAGGSNSNSNPGGVGGDTWFGGSGYATANVAAKGGTGGPASSGGASGGAAASGIGTTKYSGGSGGSGVDWSGGGGGGAAGPNGNGGNGSAGSGASSGGGGGGGGNGGGSAAGAVSGATGGTGGNNASGSGGGTASNTAAGGNGSNGGGGGGGSGTNAATGNGGTGGNGTEWDATHGSGGGGGGGGQGGGGGGIGAAGGTYGGGGGSGSWGSVKTSGGSGGQGIIVIQYVPAATLASPASGGISASGAKLSDGSTLGTGAVNGISNGLITYWTMNGQDTNWGTGVMYDRSPQGNTAQLVNLSTTTSPVQSKIGQAMTFNGTNQYMIGTQTLNPANVTESIWVKYTSAPASTKFIAGFVNGIGNGTHDKEFFINANGTASWYVFDGSGKYATSTQSIADGRWHNLIGTTDGSNIKIYVDGILQGTTAAGTSYTGYTVPDILVNGGNVTYSYSAGAADDFRVYNRILSATEITQLYQLGLGTTAAASGSKLSDGSTLGAGSVNGISNGLVGYWTLDGQDTNWGLNTTYDKSGSGNTATLISLPALTTQVKGVLAQAFSFPGSASSYISIPDSSSLDTYGTTHQVSVSAWVYFKSFYTGPCGENQIAIKGVDSTSGNFNLRVLDLTNLPSPYTTCTGSSGGPYKVEFRVKASGSGTYGDIVVGSTSITTGKWYHLVGVYNGSTETLYVNGVQDATPVAVSGTLSSNTSPLTLGWQNTGGYNYQLNGNLDDVRVYNRALSSTEVTQLYQQGLGTKVQASGAKLSNGSTVGVGSTNGVSNGLVGYWTFDGQDTNWALGQTYDRSGTNTAGSLINLATTTSPTLGRMGQALLFDGATQYVNLGNPSALNLTGPMTVSAWINPTSLPIAGSSYEDIVEKGVSGGVEQYALTLQNDASTGNASGLLFGTYNGSSHAAYYQYAGNISTSKWSHVVGVFTGTQYQVYLNGTLVGSSTDATAPSATGQNVSIGAYTSSGTPGRYFPGKIDDVRIFNRALSAKEIANLYNVGH